MGRVALTKSIKGSKGKYQALLNECREEAQVGGKKRFKSRLIALH